MASLKDIEKEKVIVRCFIDHKGRILNTSTIQNSTNNFFFENKAKQFVRELKFISAKKDYKNVCMWISVPVYFSKRNKISYLEHIHRFLNNYVSLQVYIPF